MSVSPGVLTPPSAPPGRTNRRPRLRVSVGDLPLLMAYVYVIAMVVVILVVEPGLLDGPGALTANFSLIVPLALVSFGQTLVMLTRGIDLSVGGVISVGSALLATHLNAKGWLILPEVLAIVALGTLIGVLNGVIIAYTSIQPFIVTLAMWSIWDGVAVGVLPVEGGTVSPTLVNAISGDILGIPKPVWIVVLLLVLWRWLRATRFLDDIIAIGSDETRARLLGVRIGRRKIEAYAACGLFAALAAIWVTAATQSGSPDGGDQFILASVAAVVIGGTNIFGGKGSAASSIMGAITFLLIPILVFALNLTSFWGTFFQGLILIVAVTFNSIIQTRSQR
jgi:ribose transport system permease protein